MLLNVEYLFSSIDSLPEKTIKKCENYIKILSREEFERKMARLVKFYKLDESITPFALYSYFKLGREKFSRGLFGKKIIKVHSLENPAFREIARQTMRDKYGGYTTCSVALQAKRRATIQEKYNGGHYFKDPVIFGRYKAHVAEKYGSWEAFCTYRAKIARSRKKWIVSQLSLLSERKQSEKFPDLDKIYSELKEVFKEVKKDVYVGKYIVDFYIPSKDIYLNYYDYYPHNSYPFDPKNKCHVRMIELSYSYNVSELKAFWSGIDVLKRKIAFEQGLNWVEVYSYSDFRAFLLQFSKLEEIDS